MKKHSPIFFDPKSKRWPRIKRGIYVTFFIVSIVFTVLLFSILINPVLASLTLPHSSFLPNGGHVVAALKDGFTGKTRLEKAKVKLEEEVKEEKLANKTRKLVSIGSGNTVKMGYFVNWDDASFYSLKTNLDTLNIIAGEWLHLVDESGTTTEDNLDRESLAINYIRAHKPETRILALINNYDEQEGWNSAKLGASLSTKENRAKIISSILAHVQKYALEGVSVDFENVSDKSQSDLVEFMRELTTEFHKYNLITTINLPAGNDSFDYKKYAENSDYIVLMAYDEHWSTSSAGPIASMDWFQKVVHSTIEKAGSNKVIVALGSYAYDWPDGAKDTQTKTFEEAMLTAKESEGEITMDEDSLNPTFDYAEDDGKIHHVWLLDATTIFDEMQVANNYKPHGYAIWRLGSEDPSLWSILRAPILNQNMAESLTGVEFHYDVDYEGNGEILKITATPQIGSRKIGFDQQTGLIDDVDYTTYPTSYVISRYGAKEKAIALSFDDGPDPEYTPKILDILKSYHVPGTFFVIGENAEKNPTILKREYDEGHDIGNHTFTHPNIAEISPLQVRLELGATERLFESIIGHHTHLFRPPYAEDSEPDTAEQVQPIEAINNLGYITVGMQIDPNDWRTPGIDTIVSETIKQVEEKNGNVILLHDSGGDRTQTIAALPRIIEALQKKGYHFVSVSGLLGKSRDDIMPAMQNTDKFFGAFNNIGFDILYLIGRIIGFLFVFGIILGLGRLLFVTILAIYQKQQKKKGGSIIHTNFSVAVIVPSYNEAKVINETIRSLLASKHDEKFEIIVVDDGSTDNTLEIVKEIYGDNPRVQVYSKENDGKPAALNFGIEKTKADIIITLDADTVFMRDTIAHLVKHFSDPTVGAVAGNAKVGNRINLMTRWQALEYIVSQNLDRRAFVVLNCITVVPGAVGAWRTDLVKQAGGFSGSTLAEDSDLTISISKLGYRILYEENAIGLTEAPDTVRGFVRQRYRWMFGTFQAVWKHRDMVFRRRYGWLGLFALPNILLYQIVFPLISPIMDLMMVLSIISTIIDRYAHPSTFSTDSLEKVLFYYAMFLFIDYVTAFIAFSLEKGEDKTLLIWLFLQRFFYRQLMYIVAIWSIVSSMKGHEVGWNKLERKATVKSM